MPKKDQSKQFTPRRKTMTDVQKWKPGQSKSKEVFHNRELPQDFEAAVRDDEAALKQQEKDRRARSGLPPR